MVFIFFSRKQKKEEEEEEARLTEVTPVMRRYPTHPEEASRCRSAATHPPGGGGPADSPLYFGGVSRQEISKALTRASLKALFPLRALLNAAPVQISATAASKRGGVWWGGFQSCSNLRKPFAATKKILFFTAVTSPISCRVILAHAVAAAAATTSVVSCFLDSHFLLHHDAAGTHRFLCPEL